MHQLYPTLLRMLIVVRAKGKGEDYVVSVPTYACKDEFKQVVEDDMLIRNRNFVQSAELVCLQLLCTVLVSLPSYYLILMCSFASYYGYPEHDLPASRVLVSAEGCGELRLYAQSVVADYSALSASLAETKSSSRRWENEAKESVEKVARAEVERDVALHEASMARMDVDAAESARVKVESELASVQNALAVVEEARPKAEDEANRLAVERVSLLLELGINKDEVSALQA